MTNPNDRKSAASKEASDRTSAVASRLVRRSLQNIKQAVGSAKEDYRITTGGQAAPVDALERADAVINGYGLKSAKLAQRLVASNASIKQMRGAFARLEQRGCEKATLPIQKAETKFVSDLVDSSGSEGEPEPQVQAAGGEQASGSSAEPAPSAPESQGTSPPADTAGAHRLNHRDIMGLVMAAIPSMADPLLRAALRSILADPGNKPIIEQLKAAHEAGTLNLASAVETIRASGRVLPGLATFARIAPDISATLLPSLLGLLMQLGFDRDEIIAAQMQGSMNGQQPAAQKERDELLAGEQDKNEVIEHLLGHLPPFVGAMFGAGAGMGGRGHMQGHGRHGAGGGRGRGRCGRGGGRGRCGGRRHRHWMPEGVECVDPRFEQAMGCLFEEGEHSEAGSGSGAEDQDAMKSCATDAAAASNGSASTHAAAGHPDDLPWGDEAAEAAAAAVGGGADAATIGSILVRMGLPTKAASVRHRGVECDGCGMAPIIGPRFKSAVKENFDLCAICERSMGSRKGELYLKINHAGQSPAGISVVMRDEAKDIEEEAGAEAGAGAGAGAWRH